MLRKYLSNPRLFALLAVLDTELAARHRAEGCSRCGGALHSSDYLRKPRGALIQLEERYRRRRSFCCAEEGCRRRSLPPSAVFLGRRVYYACVVVLLIAFHQQTPGTWSFRKLGLLLNVSDQTLKRWMWWFREVFPASRSWQKARGYLSAEVCNQRLPSSLVTAMLASNLDDPTGAIVHTVALVTTGASPP